jgi:2-dehydro-3-deoxyphosphooctonate aldolase (KDO 8-P synthase)
VLFGGMNVLESRDMAMRYASTMCEVTEKLGIPYVFKASFRQGQPLLDQLLSRPGLEEGLKIFQEIKKTVWRAGDHRCARAASGAPVAEVCDIIQLPAFLSRQTDLVVAMAKTGAIINIKKAQFLAPQEMKHIICPSARKPVTTSSSCASAAPALATTTWWWTCWASAS